MSRPRSRLTWGIPVPNDSSHTVGLGTMHVACESCSTQLGHDDITPESTYVTLLEIVVPQSREIVPKWLDPPPRCSACSLACNIVLIA